ncbi:DNA-directed DNA polymerase [Senna tora]|uniref:DNA-directed DNA polymerase n=1 Tax=Senna tora TaxID=362788 RepID=A0A834SGR7_9FABA|nr:DNA-directed DNA polymerase [Senna tora]
MNPRQNVSAITLRSGKELEEPFRKRSCGHDLGAESEPEMEVVMKKPAEGIQNEEKSSPLDGTFSMEFDGEVVKFNAMKRANEISSICKVGVINPILQESLELHQQGKLSNMLSESIDQVCLENPKENLNSDEVQEEVVYELDALKPKLGDPTPHDLNSSHTITSPLVMQEIPLGENYDPIQEVQRHHNPPRMEVLKKQFQKLLHTDMIYLSSESEWVNQIQVMPNEMGTVVANSE